MLNRQTVLFIFLLATVVFIVLIINLDRKVLTDEPELKTDKLTSDTLIKENKVEGAAKVKYPEDYTIVMLGDSMTAALGNSDELRDYLKIGYPGKTFEVLNYGFGSTNILSALDRLEKESYYTRVFRPINNIDYDLILIESFGHNPLSEYPLESGLKIQTGELDKIINTIKTSNPGAKIAFVATIAPNRKRYGEGAVNLSTEKRSQWADERIAYIKNHIDYANTHNIPLINIFENSLTGENGGNLNYISTTDFIHPSPTGIVFISKVISQSIIDNNLLAP